MKLYFVMLKKRSKTQSLRERNLPRSHPHESPVIDSLAISHLILNNVIDTLMSTYYNREKGKNTKKKENPHMMLSHLRFVLT